MSFHLVKPFLTTTNYTKRTRKVTGQQTVIWQKGWMEHNRQLKRAGEDKVSYAIYVDYLHGKIIKNKLPLSKQPIYKSEPNIYRRTTPYYPSLNTNEYVAVKKPIPQYTGNVIIGIATLHKSNAVPVTRKQDAVDISQMRRQ